nr:hypothetical protein [Deltaproteobacteria bacterium]
MRFPFRLIEAVEGRTDDLLQLPGRDGGTITVHPIAVHRALDDVAAGGWQVREEQDRLRVLIARPGAGFSGERVAASWPPRQAAGAAPVGVVSVEVVDDIPAGAAGKRPLVVASPVGPRRGWGGNAVRTALVPRLRRCGADPLRPAGARSHEPHRDLARRPRHELRVSVRRISPRPSTRLTASRRSTLPARQDRARAPRPGAG